METNGSYLRMLSKTCRVLHGGCYLALFGLCVRWYLELSLPYRAVILFRDVEHCRTSAGPESVPSDSGIPFDDIPTTPRNSWEFRFRLISEFWELVGIPTDSHQFPPIPESQRT
jgi:hypothetical protein